MANEIQVTLKVVCRNGLLTDAGFDIGVIQRDQSAIGKMDVTHVATTSEGNVSLAELTQAGHVALHNLDATNYVDYGLDDSGTMKALARLMPGDTAKLYLVPGVNLRMKAHTASVKVRIYALEA